MNDTNRNEAANIAGRLEKHLNRDSAFFGLALRAYPDMLFCVAQENGYFKELYGNWKNTLGWSDEELLKSPWLEFVHPEDKEKTNAEATAMKVRDAFKFVNRYRCKDGRYRILEWTCLLWNGDGTSYCLVKVLE